MSRSHHSRKPRRTQRASSLPVQADPVHWRNPEGDNERSTCNAEERATYTGAQVLCTVEVAEVTCGDCLPRIPYAAYHDFTGNDGGRQLRPFPRGWMELSARFQPGTLIRWIRSDSVLVPSTAAEAEPRDLGFGRGKSTTRYIRGNRLGMIGVIEAVNDGKRYCWPPRWVDDGEGEGNWLAESRGWLTVRFPGGNHFDQTTGELQAIAVHPEDEGTAWEPVLPADARRS